MSFSQQPVSRKIANIPVVILALIDVVLVNIGLVAAYLIRFTGDLPAQNIEPFLSILPWLSAAVVAIFFGLGMYERRRGGYLQVVRSTVIGVIFIAVATMALTFWLREFSFPRSVIILGAFFQVILVTLWRVGCWHLERRLHGQRKLLVIGEREEVEKLLDKVLDLPEGWFRVQRILEPASVDKLCDYLDDIDSVLLVPSLSDVKKTQALAACQSAGCEAFLVPGFYEILVGRAQVAQLDDLPVMEIQDISLTRTQRLAKRTMDIAISFIGLLIALPVMFVCAVIIRVTSPGGSVFFTQERVGRGERVFKLVKFRTMVPDAEKKTGPVLATENDPRITQVGRIMRITRLDELPQLFNVLKGDMSIVGPRPERPVFVEEFKEQYENYGYRHMVKPGITGLAQVAGKYTTSPEDKLRFDLYYIRNYSLSLDFKILFQTIPVVFSKESSTGKSTNVTDKHSIIHHIVNDRSL